MAPKAFDLFLPLTAPVGGLWLRNNFLQRTQKSQHSLTKGGLIWRIDTSNFKTYCKTTRIRLCGTGLGHRGQWSGSESPEMSSHLMVSKGAQAGRGEGTVSSANGIGTTAEPRAKEGSWTGSSHRIQKGTHNGRAAYKANTQGGAKEAVGTQNFVLQRKLSRK